MSERGGRRRRWGLALGVGAAILLAGIVALVSQRPQVRIGSKAFTEGVVLGDVLRFLAENEGVRTGHKKGMGGTPIVFGALAAGDIDAYVEYTGTLQNEIFASLGNPSLEDVRRELEARGIRMGAALGFNNSYAIGMKKERAATLGIQSLSDLGRHPELTFGLSHEFTEREDGWPALKRRYGLPQEARALDHDLAYRAIDSGEIDAIDVYTTDAKIPMFGLVALKDDLGFFPSYDAVVLYRADLETRHPKVVRAFERLQGRVDETLMARMNAEVDVDKQGEAAVAADLLEQAIGFHTTAETETLAQRILRTTKEHVALVVVSLAIAVVLGLTLGVLAAKLRRLGQGVIGVVSAAQTFPGLALLALFVPILGIGALPTIVALIIYSLLPIVRNTYAGITGIARPLAESSQVLGLSPRTRLLRVELPLAAPSIFAGVKTAAVWNIGLATLGGLIAAGGYGDSIMTGIRRADDTLILAGAIPAIVMALVAQVLFDGLEKVVVSKGLRNASR